MSRKNKTLRAFLHQNSEPTIQQAWDAAWKAQGDKAYSLKIQGLESEKEHSDEMVDRLATRIQDVRKAVADYIYSEGCSCCQHDSHHSDGNKLGELLVVPQYSDESGVDWESARERL
jgi:hypothetical protein